MNILIITEHFPPSNKVSSFRPESWYRYFPEFGLRPIILTLNEESDGEDVYSVKLEKTKSSLPSKLQLIRTILNDFAFLSKSIYYPLITKGLEICSKEKVDFIVASGGPFTLFKIAQELSSKTGIPWIADYRDGWSTNVTYKKAGLSKKLLSLIYSLVERPIVRTSSFIITASPTYKKDLLKLFPEKDIAVIYNGFIEEDFREIKPIVSSKRIVITYLGTLYSYQKLETFLEGVKLYLADRSIVNLEINFFGLNKSEFYRVESFQSLYPGVIKLHPKIGRIEVLKAAANSSLLLLLLSKDTIAIPAKTFDYIALRIPILVVENDEDVIYDILKGIPNVFFADTSDEVLKILSNQALDSGNTIKYSRDKDISKWSRREQSKSFVDLLCAYRDKL